jgi:hypothetical protein
MSKKAAPRTVSAKTPHSAARPHILSDRVWLVLARRSYEEPLRQVGAIEADDLDLARVYARSIYDEFAWVEMVVVPREAVQTVIAS